MTLKNNRALFLHYLRFYTSLPSHQWIQTGVTVRKRSIRVKIKVLCLMWPWNLMYDLGKQYGALFTQCQALCIISKPSVNSNWSFRPETLNSGQNRRLFFPSDLEFWQMILKTMGYLFYSTSSYVHHFKATREFKLELQSGNAQIGWKSASFLSCVTLEVDRLPWKTIGHHFYNSASFLHHSVTTGEFKMELQSGNAQKESKLIIFFSHMTLKFDEWPLK